MEENIERKIIVTKGGQQIPVQAGLGVTVGIYLSDDEVKEEIKVDVTDEEFAKIQEQAVTNDIPAAILRSKKAE